MSKEAFPKESCFSGDDGRSLNCAAKPHGAVDRRVGKQGYAYRFRLRHRNGPLRKSTQPASRSIKQAMAFACSIALRSSTTGQTILGFLPPALTLRESRDT